MNTVLTIGTFDMLHVGHLELLRECQKMAGEGGWVVVAVNSDDFVARFKRRPVLSQADRMDVLRSLREVDAVVENVGDEVAAVVIDRHEPNILAVGDDWKDRDYLGQLWLPPGWLERRGIELVYVPRTTGVSTTSLLERAASR